MSNVSKSIKPMTADEASRYLLSYALGNPPSARPCPDCVLEVFPKLASHRHGPDCAREHKPNGVERVGAEWRPGLRLADDHRAWLRDFKAWEEAIKNGAPSTEPPRAPTTPTYVRCETCGGLGRAIDDWDRATAALGLPPTLRAFSSSPSSPAAPSSAGERFCPCGSGRPFSVCHGADVDEDGGPGA